MATGATTAGGDDGGTRAHAAARTGPEFTTRAARAARSFGDRLLDRFAPSSRIGPGTAALSFADRLISPYLSSAQRHRSRVGAPSAERAVGEDVTWLFPVPWYRDDLAWLASAAVSRAPQPSRREAGAAARSPAMPLPPVAAPARAGLRAERAGAARSFSPILPLRAIAAAELVAELFAPGRGGGPSTGLRMGSPSTGLRTGGLAAAASAPSMTVLSARAFEPARRRPPRGEESPASPPPQRPRPSAAAANAPLAPASARARAAELLAEVVAAGELDRSQPAAAPPLGLRPDLVTLDGAVEATGRAAAPLLRFVPPVSAAPGVAAAAASLAPGTGGPSSAPDRRWLTALARVPSRAPAPASLVAIAAPPRALSHVAWSDRWLARFAGGSPATVASLGAAASAAAAAAPDLSGALVRAFAGARLAPAERALRSAEQAPIIPLLAPDAAGARRGRVSRELRDADRPTLPPPAPREDQLTDEAFAAISAAATRDRKPGRFAREAAVPPGPRGAAPSALVEAAAASPVPWRGPGLAPALGSSPVIPALAAALDAPPAPVFDVRAVWPAPALAAMTAGAASFPGAGAGAAMPLAYRLLESLAALAPSPIYLAGEASRWAADSGGGGAAGAAEPRPVSLAAAAPALLALGSPWWPEAEATAPSATAATPATAATAATAATPATPGAARRQTTARAAAAATDLARPAVPAALVRRSPAPGAVGQMARSFATERALAASDLSLDFVSPEILAAARVYGFDADDAARAVRLAESGDAPLAALKDAVAMTFIRAVSPSFAPAPASETDAPEPPQQAPALVQAAAALPSSASTPGSIAPRHARGATLWPESVIHQLGIRGGQAENQQPRIESALELLAAGAVADAAVWVQSFESGLGIDEAVGWSPVAGTGAPRSATGAPVASAPPPLSSPGESDEDAAPEAAPPWIAAAAAALPGPVRPTFEAIYLALTRDAATRRLPPAERAARALAVARRSSASRSLSARDRAAVAWSVLPTVLVGEGEPPAAGDFDLAPEARDAGTGRAAAAFMPAIQASPPPPRHYPAPTAAPPLVQTGPTREMLAAVAEGAARGERTAQAAMPAMQAMARGDGIPEWFAKAAAEIAATERGGSQGISLAEMTLVAASPRSVVAASPRSGTGSSPSATSAHPSAGGSAGDGASDGQGKEEDLENMVHELAGMLRDYFEIQRMRNGD